ncbi:uncharacterized protein LOC128644346, partial [Bombina bombina]|uniref:uncharacterized protein LOC128644346 n=1 Tax=Bombina bombina TaxID=8345 RepID=UPI00235AB7A1
MHTTVKTDIRQRPTITDRARPIQKPPIYIIPTQMQQPSGSNPSISVERHIGSEPSVAVQRPCNSDSSVVIQRYSRPNPTALLLPRADLITPMQRPPRADPPAPVQRPPRADPPAPVQRPPRADPPAPVQRPPRAEPPAPVQRPPRADPPAPVQRPSRADPPAPVQRPPRADPPAPVQRPPRAVPPAPVQRPPRADPPSPVQRPPRADPPAPVQRPPRADPPAPVQRPPRADPPAPVQRPPRIDPPAQMQSPTRADNPTSIQRLPRTEPPVMRQSPPRTEPPVMRQSPPTTEPPSEIQKPPRTEPPAALHPRTDSPTTIQRPLRTEPQATLQRPPRTGPPASMQRPPRTDPPGSMQRPPRTDPPGSMQRPPRTDPPGSVQRPPRTDPPGSVQRPPRTDPPGSVQRPPRTDPPGLMQRPLRTDPPGLMQRPLRTDHPDLMQRPPRTDPPGSMQRPPRTDAPGSMQRPPRTDPPGSMQRPPRTDPPGSMQRPPRTDPPGSMQRPPRTDPPGSMQRPPRTDPPVSMQRPPRTDPPVSMQRPPRTDPPASMQSPPRTDPPASMQRPPRTDPPASMQRPPRTDPPASMQRPPRTDPPDSMQRATRTDLPDSMQRPPRIDPPDSMQRATRTDPPDSMQRPPRIDPPDSMQRPPRTDPPKSLQRPPRIDPPDSMQRSPRTDPPDSMQRSPRTDPPDSMQRPPRTDPPDSMQRPPRTDPPDSMQRPPRTDPPGSMQRPPRTDPPGSMQRPPRTDPPGSMQRSLRTDPPGLMQRPPRTDPPGSMQRPPRTDPPDSMQRPPRTDPPDSMQRPPRTDPPDSMQRPPRTDPPDSMQRPPRTDPPGSMQRPLRRDPPDSMQRPPRTDPPDSMQRPPRTDPPAPMQRPPRSDPPALMQRPPRTDAPSLMQRPPRTDPPALMQRPPRTDPPALMQRPPRTDPPALMQRPPRTDPPALMQRPPRTDPSALMQRPPRTDPPGLIQRPPRSDPPAPIQRPPRTDPPDQMQRPPRADPPAPKQKSAGIDSPAFMQKPPRVDPITVKNDSSELVQRTLQSSLSRPVQDPSHTGCPAVVQMPIITKPQLGVKTSSPMQRDLRNQPHSGMQGLVRTESVLSPMEKPIKTGPSSLMQNPSCSGSTIIMQKNTSSDTRNRDDAHTAYMSLDSPQSSVQDEVEHTDDLSSGGLVGYVNESQKDQKRGNSYQQPGPNGENQSPDVGLLVRNTLGAGRFLSLGPSSPDAKVYDVAEEDEGLYITLEVDDLEDEEKKKRKRYMSAKRKRDAELQATLPCDIDPTLDQKLEDGAKHHNLTVVNVRNILHEVITNEHVVAMMKAAITETEEMPMFEPKMTRSKLKEVVGKGVVIPTWNLSPIKKASEIKPPQFVDIPLEEEDSSDEEYQPEEEEEDETAEESLLESDVESTSSSPRGPKRPRVHHPSESMETEEEGIKSQQITRVAPFRHISAEVVPMGPPPPPPKPKNIKDSTFMEKLHAVDEELASTAVCLDSLQSLDDKLIACRTRSKRPLKDVPLGQLEAELQAPDITPDMYDANTADDEEWQMWLRSLMQDDVGNEDDADDDDDDPEYNILEDFEEPDTEDLRNDRAVRITKKEVNELMEELFETFETFQDEIDFSHVEDEEPDEEDSKDSNPETVSNFNTPQAIRFEEPLANIMNEQHSTVKAKLDFLRMKKSVMKPTTPFIEEPKPLPPAKVATVLSLNMEQKRRLQQQMQQHVQLLTQMHLLTCRNPKLSVEADTARMFLVELSNFANISSSNNSSHSPNFQTMFQPCNLKEALQLIPIFHSQVPEECEPSKPAKRNVYELSYLPRHLAWIMITHTVFIYPELLPVCALKPRGPRDRVFFTKPEDNLLTLGLKHFEGTEFIKTMISKYLLTTKTAHQLTVRIKNLTMKKTPDNIIKFYKKTKLIPMMGKCCEDVQVHDVKPPIEREKHRMPFWLKASLSNIEAEMGKIDALVPDTRARPKHYPLIIPPTLVLNLKPLPKRFYLKTLRQKRSSILKPLLIRPSSCTNTSSLVKTAVKPSDPQPVPVRLYKRVSPIIHSAVPIQGIMGVHSVNIPAGRKPQEPYAPFISNESCQLMSFPQPVHITQAPVSQVKTMLPALVPQKIKKPPICGVPRKKNVLRNPGFKPTHPMHTAPVLFTVPNGNVKLVSLGSTCGMIQPVSNGGAIPVTTLLLNPTTFPLNQTLLSPPLSQTVVSAPLPIPKEQLVIQDQSNFAPEVSLESVAANEEVRTNLNEESGALDDNTHITITIEVEEKSQVSAGEDDGQEGQDGNTVEENGGLIKDGENIQDKERQTWHVLEGCCFTSEDEKEIVEGGVEISPLKDFNCPLYQSEFPLSPLDKKTERELEFDL